MSEPDCVTYEEYSKVLAENDALRAERDALQTYKACTELALRQVYDMFDPPLVGTVGLKVQIYKLREQALAAEAKLAGGVSQPKGDFIKVTDEMVSRFLQWSLPKSFAPDCGISFTPVNHPNAWPVGTNLLTAIEAREMLEYVLATSAVENL